MSPARILALALVAVSVAACGSGAPVPPTADNAARAVSQTPPIFDSNRGAPL